MICLKIGGIRNAHKFTSYEPRRKGVAAAEFTKEIVEHVKKEYSTLDWILEELSKKSGFSILETNVENGFIYNYLCAKQIP